MGYQLMVRIEPSLHDADSVMSAILFFVPTPPSRGAVLLPACRIIGAITLFMLGKAAGDGIARCEIVHHSKNSASHAAKATPTC